MTQDEIIEMATQVGMYGLVEGGLIEEFKAFAKLVAAKEREACAKVCDDIQDCGPENGCCPTYWNEALEKAEEVIRARGEA